MMRNPTPEEAREQLAGFDARHDKDVAKAHADYARTLEEAKRSGLGAVFERMARPALNQALAEFEAVRRACHKHMAKFLGPPPLH